MEFWDIYDKDKKPTGRTMKKNDWILKDLSLIHIYKFLTEVEKKYRSKVKRREE